VGEIGLEPFNRLRVPEVLATMPGEFGRRLEDGKSDFQALLR
jgi:hypothetical protein